MATKSPARAVRPNKGPRTTLRVPAALARRADEIAKSDGATRNEALVQLALLGAEQRSRLDATAALATRRTAGILKRRLSAVPESDGLPSEQDLAKLIESRADYYLA